MTYQLQVETEDSWIILKNSIHFQKFLFLHLQNEKKMAILVPSAWTRIYNTGGLPTSIPKGILKIKSLHLTYRINGWAVFSCLFVGVFLEHLNLHKGIYLYLFWMNSHTKPSKVHSEINPTYLDIILIPGDDWRGVTSYFTEETYRVINNHRCICHLILISDFRRNCKKAQH